MSGPPLLVNLHDAAIGRLQMMPPPYMCCFEASDKQGGGADRRDEVRGSIR